MKTPPDWVQVLLSDPTAFTEAARGEALESLVRFDGDGA
jgi:hypothetical protein